MAEIHRLDVANSTETSTEDVIALLEDVIRELRSGEQSPNKAMVLLLSDIPQEDRPYPYDTCWRQAGMTMSECIALMRVSEMSFLNQMGQVVLPEDLT